MSFKFTAILCRPFAKHVATAASFSAFIFAVFVLGAPVSAFAQTTVTDTCSDKMVNRLVSTTENTVSTCESSQDRVTSQVRTRARSIDSYARVLARSATARNVCRAAHLLTGCDLRFAKNIIRDERSLMLTRAKTQIELAQIRANVRCQQASRAVEDMKLQLKLCGYQ